MNAEDYRYITTLVLGSLGASTTIILFMIALLWSRMDKRFDRIESDLREGMKILMTHNTDIARLKDKTGIG